ncbi:hypothetical protein IFM89_028880 [Coptis chinensis]|uniref:Uncharacterized protein n=1 Tax=Coptis chinensis TaxID=261450 RepID=A0A835HC87_9MAGN|nr:hypothetical protein IFM89_028880 [Coptis chinensis]
MQQQQQNRNIEGILMPRHSQLLECKVSIPTICLIEEEVDRGIQYYLKSLVGRLDLVKMDLNKVKTLVAAKWVLSGRPMHVDETTAMRKLGYFASILANVDLSKKIPNKIWVESKKHGVAFWQEDLAQKGKAVVTLAVGESDVNLEPQGQQLTEKNMSRNQKKKWRQKNRAVIVREEHEPSQQEIVVVEGNGVGIIEISS